MAHKAQPAFDRGKFEEALGRISLEIRDVRPSLREVLLQSHDKVRDMLLVGGTARDLHTALSAGGYLCSFSTVCSNLRWFRRVFADELGIWAGERGVERKGKRSGKASQAAAEGDAVEAARMRLGRGKEEERKIFRFKPDEELRVINWG